MELSGKTALVTGGAQGIGHQIVKGLLRTGAMVFVFDVADPSEKIAGVEYYKVDITSAVEVEEAFKKINRGLDILVNNAGIMRRGSLFDATDADFNLLMNVNLKGMWLITKYAAPYLAKDATVFFMSSRHGMTLKSDPAVYCLSKHGVWGLAEILKVTKPEYRVKVAFPGSVDTALTWVQVSEEDKEAKRKTVVSPEFIGGKIVELICSDYSRLVFDEGTKEYRMEI